MPGQVRVKVAVSQSTPETTEKRCWTWSIYPLVFLAQLIGVDLVSTSLATTSCRNRHKRWIMFYGVFCLLLNAFINIYTTVLYYHRYDEISRFYISEGNIVTKAYLWNLSIDGVSFVFGSISCHFVLIKIVRNRWSSLNTAFKQSEFLLDANFYAKLRRLSILGVAYITFGVCGVGIVGVVTRLSKENSLQIQLMAFSSIIFQMYPVFALIMASTALYASSATFQSIALQLQSWHDQYWTNNYLTGANLTTLKGYYVLACQTVDTVQACFGWSLLMVISYHFVTVINMTFYMFGQIQLCYCTISDIVFFLFYFFNPFVVCSAAECVRVQSDNVLKALLRMQIKPTDTFNRKQVSEFIWQVVLSSPRVSVLGFFSVGKKLIPTMIGTTLSYYVILRQFHLSESEASTP